MPRSLLVLSLALVLGVASFSWAAPPNDPNAPPEDVQAILSKARSGVPPTAAERQRLHEWQSQRLGAAGGMPPDVAAIMAKARQGIPPSPDEIAKLKAWAAHAKDHKQQLIDTGGQIESDYRAATPDHPTQRGPVTDNLVHGVVKVEFDQDVQYDQGQRHGFARNHATAQLPVVYVVDGDGTTGGSFHLRGLLDGTGNAGLPAPTGNFWMQSHETGPDYKSDFNGQGSISGNEVYRSLNKQVATAFNPSLLDIRRPAGASRAYLTSVALPLRSEGEATTVTIDHRRRSSDTGPTAFDWAGMTIDNLQPGVEGGVFGPEQLAGLKQWGVDDPMKKAPPELRAALKTVSFDFDADRFMKAFGTGQFTESSTYRYTIKKKDGKGRDSVYTSTLTLTLSTDAGVEAVVEPEDSHGYDNWIPEGPAIGAATPKFNSKVWFVTHLRKHSDHSRVDLPFKVTYRLTHVSKQPGYCMNYPDPISGPNADLDLSFEAEHQPPGAQPGGDGQSLSLEPEHATEAVEVTAKDYGAYGVLEAEVTQGGNTVPVTYESGGKKLDAMRVPRDDDENHIADEWEREQGIFEASYPASDDRDDNTSPLSKGDGLTLYEEYRGFVTSDSGSPAWQRLDPHRRDLFVYLEDGMPRKAAIQEGIDKFAEIVGVAVHRVPAETYFKRYPERGADPGNWVDYNQERHTPEGGNGMCAIRFKLDPTIESTARAVPIDGQTDRSSNMPCETKWVAVNVGRAETWVNGVPESFPPKTPLNEVWQGWKTAQAEAAKDGVKIDLSAIHTAVETLGPRMIDDLVAYMIMHEMGHAVGARHHFVEANLSSQDDASPSLSEEQKTHWLNQGQGGTFAAGQQNCPMRYWQVWPNMKEQLMFGSGLWNPAEQSPPPHGPWVFCNLHEQELRLHR